MKHQRSERGQVLVLIILAIVAIFGFAAIAVDGGRVYAERRRAQTAADASAMAAAFAAIEKQDWSQAAMALVKQNDFNDIQPGIEADEPMDVHIHHPPVSGPYAGDDEYYQVFIRSQVDQVFSQIVWQGQMEVTVEAVARAQPAKSVFPGHAMVATNETECNAVNFTGTGDTYVNGGNIFSNSDEEIPPNGNDNCASGRQGGGGSIIVVDGEILTVGNWEDDGHGGVIDPKPDENDNPDRLEMPNWPTPACYHETVMERKQSDFSTTKVLEPGRYSGIKITGDDWEMKPGMYCLTSTGFTLNGGNLTGNGVSLMVLGGDVNINGSGSIALSAPYDLKDAGGVQWAGMLIYMPWNNGGGIDISGGSGTIYTGTILAPGPRDNKSPKCKFTGNSGSLGLRSNIICNTVEVTGTGGVDIYYDPDANYHLPPSIDLSQ